MPRKGTFFNHYYTIMKRRNFLRNGLATSAFAGISGMTLAQSIPNSSLAAENSFKLKYAPHFGMFKHLAGEDKIDQLKYAADQGFKAWEHNGMKNETVDMQEKIADTMSDLGMEMGVFVAHKIYWSEPSLTTGKQDSKQEFLDQIRESVDVAKRVNARWMTVVPGFVDLRQEHDYQTANVVDALRRASDILEPHGLVMVLEPLNYMNHPGLFLEKAAQAYSICKAVDSPSCKILYDIYHQQITEGNLIPNIDLSWDEIAYFQIGDNPGRKEPTSGEINYKNVFKHIYAKGWEGILGMEHGISRDGKQGELGLIQAYRTVDDFNVS